MSEGPSKYLRIQRRLAQSHCVNVITDATRHSFAVFPADVREEAFAGGWGFFMLAGSSQLLAQLADTTLGPDAVVIPALRLDEARQIAAGSTSRTWLWSQRRAWVLLDQPSERVLLRGVIALPSAPENGATEPRMIWQFDSDPHRRRCWWFSVDLERSRPPANVPMTGITAKPESPGWYDALLPVRPASSICIGCRFDSKNCSLKSDVSRSHRCRLRTPPLPDARDNNPGGGGAG